MISRDKMIKCYMINDKKVIAEMLYDTIARYENKIETFESRVCKNCKHFKPREIEYGETFISSACLELEIPSISEDFGCNKFEPKIKDS